MHDLRPGINLWSQASDWPAFLAAGQRAEALGYEHLGTWDHIQAIAQMQRYRQVGFHTFIAELAAPYDAETMETLTVVKPMVESLPWHGRPTAQAWLDGSVQVYAGA